MELGTLQIHKRLLGHLELIVFFLNGGELLLDLDRHRFATQAGTVLMILHDLKK